MAEASHAGTPIQGMLVFNDIHSGDGRGEWEKVMDRQALAVMADVETRAGTTPWLTAFRASGDAVGYGELAESIDRYQAIVREHGLARTAALYAAVSSRLVLAEPAYRQSDALAAATGQVIAWLGRNLQVEPSDLSEAG